MDEAEPAGVAGAGPAVRAGDLQAATRPGSSEPPRPARWRVAGALALAATLAGVLHTASFAPLGVWALQPLALAALFWLARGRSVRAAAWAGGWFGVGWLGSGLWWVFISMHRFGGLPAPPAALAVLLLAALLSLYSAAALAACARWGPRSDDRRAGAALRFVALAAACWLLAELARATWLTGFPWLASGYAHTDGPLAAWAPWLGVYGIGGLSAAVAAALAWALPPPGRAAARPAAGAAQAAAGHRLAARGGPPSAARAVLGTLLALLALGALTLPQDFTHGSGRLRVSLLQPNVPQDLKFDPARLAAGLDALAQALAQARGTLVVTPESVVPLPYAMVDPARWRQMRQALRDGAVAAPPPGATAAPPTGAERAALVGVFLGNDVDGYVNSMIGLWPRPDLSAADQAAEPRYRYGKRHLLPFGEFIPPGFRWLVRAMAIPLDDQTAGQSQAPLRLAGQRLRPLICYEDLFGEDIVASAVGPDAATVFVNASNLAWFGRWMVQDQHLQFSRMRALEFQRPVVRSTNTGSTAVVDHRGRVSARLPPEVQATLEAEVEGRVGSTPYARWLATYGLWPLWLGAALALTAAARPGPFSRLRRP